MACASRRPLRIIDESFCATPPGAHDAEGRYNWRSILKVLASAGLAGLRFRFYHWVIHVLLVGPDHALGRSGACIVVGNGSLRELGRLTTVQLKLDEDYA
jgi:hypothetical protein